MSLFTRILLYTLTILTSITRSIFSCLFNLSNAFLHIPSLLVGCVNRMLYALSPSAFIVRCHERYGPVHTVLLGSSRVKVISSGDAISSVFSASHQLLNNDIAHRAALSIVSGVTSNHAHFHEVMTRELFPLVDKRLSLRFLGQTTQGFGPILLSEIKSFLHNRNGPISLTSLINEPLYNTTNHVLFGSAFPAGTYRDFRTLDKSIPYRFGRSFLLGWPSNVARTRLLNSLKGYLQQEEVIDHDDQFSHGLAKTLKDNGIQPFEGAQLILPLFRGIHGNTSTNSLFLLSFLLGNPNAFAQVRTEIDSAVNKFGSLKALLEAGADKLDDSSFQLLTSAIMETLRITALYGGVRQANCDFDLSVKDGVIPIKKGELVLWNLRAIHMDADTFPDPESFVVDRFAQQPYRRRQLQTEGFPFHSLGGGKHICKGRWLAIYTIKVLMIILLHEFDILPAKEDSVGWCKLRIHPRSISVAHTEDDISVRMVPRNDGARL
ncbi:cytochrome P450 [Chiua virens]|nr:cytochrome P450 [Chiua virens]